MPSKPKYQRIADDLRAMIISGEYAAGAQLPTKTELMRQYGVAVNTVERAIDELRKAGLVETHQGAGMFVCEPSGIGHSPEPKVLITQIAALADQVKRLADRVDAIEKLVGERP